MLTLDRWLKTFKPVIITPTAIRQTIRGKKKALVVKLVQLKMDP